MRINSINAFTTNHLNFNGENNKRNGMRNAAKAAMVATALSALAPMHQSCEKENYVHNHYFEIPTDTFTQKELVPTPVPPQIIFIETQLPGDTVTLRDTIQIPGDTVFIKDDWKSDVPPKEEEILDNLGIKTTGNGKFILSTSFYDRKNNELVQRHLNGKSSSRDGSILVYNVIKTRWDDESEGVVLGKNEKFEKHLVYLSEDKRELGMKILQPKVDIKPAGTEGKSSWGAFTKGTLSTPGNWEDANAFFMSAENGIVNLSNGFSLKSAMVDQAVTVTNPHNSEWDLREWNVIKGDPD